MQNEIEQSINYPKLISNQPCGNDLFEGKSQERVSENITFLLKNEDECKVIGIDGGWGTGKSNLIAIVKKKLQLDKFHFFVYDAWGHQEDLKRRSLLEELTFFLTENRNELPPILSGKEWKNKLKDLLSKSKETETKTIPSLSIGIVFTGLALILTPLFKTLSDSIDCIWIKILVNSLPLLSIVVLFLVFYLKKTSKSDRFIERTKQASSQMFYLYQENQKKDVTFETISEDEPSVKKFRDWMKNISDDLGDNKLVLVFDNMDRLPNDKVLELWSSIHTFFAENTYENIKVIIPFDRQNIKIAFTNPNDSNTTDYANDFINKTFNVVYRVSPPILSDWKKFFTVKWTEAFGQMGEDFSKVIQIFDHLSKSKTPRDIVVFVNEFVAIAQLNENVPYKYIGLFILAKETILTNPEKEVVKATYLQSLNFLYENDDDLPRYIASLVYQIEPDRAIEIVFKDKLTTALNNNYRDDIETIADSNNFEDLLAKSITEVENFENATLGLYEIEEVITEKTWDDLYLKLDKELLTFVDSKIKPYQLIILRKVSYKKDYLKYLIKRLSEAEKYTSIDYHESIKKIDESISQNSIDINLSDFLSAVNTTPEDFFSLLKKIKDEDNYLIQCNNIALNKYLENLTEDELFANSTTLSYIPKTYSLLIFNKYLENQIKLNQADRLKVASYYDCYKNSSKEKPLKVLIDDSNLYSHFANSPEMRDDFYYDLICMRISKFENYSSNYVSYFENELENDSPDNVQKMAVKIEYYANYGDILLKVNTFDRPLLNAVAKLLTLESFGTQRMNILSVTKKFDKIYKKIKVTAKDFMKNLSQWKYESITIDNISDIISNNVDFFKVCKSFETELSKHCIKLANEFFDKMSKEEWIKEFEESDSSTIEISSFVLINQYPAKAISAIKDTLVKISKSEISVPDKSIWDQIISKTNKSSLKSAIRDIKVLFNNSLDINEDLFLFFGDWLFIYGEMESQDSSLTRIFRKEIIESEECLSIISQNKEVFRNVYENSREKEDFNNELKLLAEDENQSSLKILEILNLKIDTGS